MDEAQRAKIETGVLNCLDECRAADQPYSRFSAFIESLKASPSWTAEEIIEVQSQVIRALLFRHGLRDNVASAATPAAAASRQSWLGCSVFGVLLILLIAAVMMATFIGGGIFLRGQFQGLREEREKALKALRQPPLLPPPALEPAEPAPPAEPEPTRP
jgi:hypothetical protein